MTTRNDLIYKCISNSRYTPYLLAKKSVQKEFSNLRVFKKGVNAIQF